MPHFTRVDEHRFTATHEVSGAWDVADQHIAAALGLLAHAVERDAERRGSGALVVTRLSYDILGTLPVDTVEVAVQVVRPGRTIELVEATMRHAGRDAVRLRAWLMQPRDTRAHAGSALTPMPAREDLPRWDPTTVWPGGFIESLELRRQQEEPGRARFWARSRTRLVDDEPVSDVARFTGLLDIANGMTVRAAPDEVAFPNLDLTAHYFRQPRGEWIGFDTTVSFGADGVGLTSSVIHDETGPVGTLAQSLTVRPRPGS